jgi:hypothetical protein
MIRLLSILVLLLAAVGLPLPAQAQGGLGTAFTYQGELRSGGAPATGTHDFEFRLFDAASGGAQVGATVALNAVLVQDGLFSVNLDFGDQFTGARRFLAISVRPTGQPAFTALSPRLELLPAPYAQHAEFVSDDSVVGANIVDGSVGSADLATASVTTTRIANGAVTADKLAPGVIGELSLVDGSVTTPKLAAQAVTTPKLAAGAVTAAKIADGAVGLAQINTNQVQARISGSCPTGQPLLGVDSSGGLQCDRSIARLTAVDTGPSGSHVGFALRDSGRPVLAFLDSANELNIVTCIDEPCTERTTRTVSGFVGSRRAVALGLRSNGDPFVAFSSGAARLALYRCNSAACASGTLLSFGTTFAFDVAMVVRADDRPLIAAYDGNSLDLVLFDCVDTDCNTIQSRTLASAGNTGMQPSMIIRSNGRPLIAYRDVTNGDLRVYDCANANCTSGTDRMVDFMGSVGAASSIAQNAAGEIVISHQDVGSGDLKLTHCTLSSCDFSNPANGQTQTLVTTGDVGAASSVVIREGDLPLVFYWNGTDNDLEVYDCTNNRCQFGSARTIEGTLGRAVGNHVVAKMRGGLPVAAYADDDNQSFRVLGCGNADCVNP